MVVLAQAPEHVSAVIKRLLNRGIKVGSIARALRYNVVTHRLARLNQEETKEQYRKLDQHEIATLAEYVNFDYWCDYLYREGEESLPESWQVIRWKVATGPRSRWFGFKSWVHQQIPATQDWVYLRALLPLGDVIEESQARAESFVEFEHTLKRAQKEAIALSALTAAYRGSVSVDEVLALLRN